MRALFAVLLVASFLGVSLAPCPQRVAIHSEDCAAHAGAVVLTAPCPCGCADRAPVAGSSPRLGVALLSASPDLEPPCAATPAVPKAERCESALGPSIDHVPRRAA